MKDFFKQAVASFVGTIAAIGLLVSLSTAGGILLLLLLSVDNDPVVESKTALVLDLGTPIRDTNPPLNLRAALARSEEEILPLREVVTAIEAAAEDDRITTLFIDGRRGNRVSGYSNLSEIRQALQTFKASGKSIIAYGVNWSETGYYLASIADKVLINPMGGIELNGLGTQPMFYAGAFEKYGIGVQTVRVGSFKGAIEPFTRQDLSPENRQQQQALLDELWQNYRETVAQKRNVTPTDIQAIADNQGLIMADAAKTAGLVDEVQYWDEVLDAFKVAGVFMVLPADMDEDKEDGKAFRQVSIKNYHAALEADQEVDENAPTIAVLYLDGAIVNGKGTLNTVGSERYAAFIRKLQAEDDIKAVVLRINSPGGSASAADIIWREVELLQQQKPVIVSMGNVAASGGYWIATGAEKILAQPNTITGSIGVFSVLFNIETLGDRLGLAWDEVETAELATLGSTVTPKTPLELAVFQRAANQVYDTFLDKVAISRDLSKPQVEQVAQGRVWSGKAAKQVGLVDQLGGLEMAITEAAASAELGDTWQVDTYPARKNLESLLLESLNNSLHTGLAQDSPLPKPLEAAWQQLGNEWQLLDEFTDPQGIYARLPFLVPLK